MTTSDGQLIVVEVSHVTSGGSMNSILEGSLQPTPWSPGDQSWVDQANQTWSLANNMPMASQAYMPTIYAPEVEALMGALEDVTGKYGRQAPALLELMAQQGPSFLHAAAVPEADTIKFNSGASLKTRCLPLACPATPKPMGLEFIPLPLEMMLMIWY